MLLANRKWKIAVISCIVLITSIPAFSHPVYHLHALQEAKSRDTVPAFQKDIDFQLQQLDKAMNKLDEQLSGKKWEEVQQKLQESLSKIDFDKIANQAEEALSKVDLKKIQLEAELAVKKIDWQKMQAQIDQAMKEAENKDHWKEMQKEMKKSMEEARQNIEKMKALRLEDINLQLEHTREALKEQKLHLDIDLKQMQKDLKKNEIDIQLELNKAKQQVENAKRELTSYKAMISQMEKEGLLTTGKDFKIEYKNGSLFIDGKQQSADIADRYRDFFKKEKVVLESKAGNFRIKD